MSMTQLFITKQFFTTITNFHQSLLMMYFFFQDTKPLRPWEGVKLATSQGDICPQIPYTPGTRHRPIGNEDCLYMNVFTPEVSINQGM